MYTKLFSGLKNFLVFFFIILSSSFLFAQSNTPPFAIIIHGGAGAMHRGSLSGNLEKQYREKLQEALQKGYEMLDQGASAVDAVVETIKIMEDSPLFNAGKGAVFTAEGKNELDASIMDGSNLNAGAVAGVTRIKNPIMAARQVMLQSPHVLLSGDGANRFAEEQGIDMVNNHYFYTKRSWESLQRIKAAEKEKQENKHDKGYNLNWFDTKLGTVGCVALDRKGNLAAATSTGGLTNKSHGRIGDSPIIGAGTYADNNTCAISCTGQGEYFIRLAIAYRITAMMAFANISMADAMKMVIHQHLEKLGGVGGAIGLDHQGNIAIEFNTPSMFRAYHKAGESAHVMVYGDE